MTDGAGRRPIATIDGDAKLIQDGTNFGKVDGVGMDGLPRSKFDPQRTRPTTTSRVLFQKLALTVPTEPAAVTFTRRTDHANTALTSWSYSVLGDSGLSVYCVSVIPLRIVVPSRRTS